MYNLERIEPPSLTTTSPLELVRHITLSDPMLFGKGKQWRAAAWQLAFNQLVRTRPELNLPPFEVVRVAPRQSTVDGGELVAAVRPVNAPTIKMVLVFFNSEKGKSCRLACRDAVDDEFALCFDPLVSEGPINGVQFAALNVSARPTKPWQENLVSAENWLRVYNEQVERPDAMPSERFELIAVAPQRQYHSHHRWLVAHVRSEKSGINMVLDYTYAEADRIICRMPKIGDKRMMRSGGLSRDLP